MSQHAPQVGYTDLVAMPDDGRRYEIHGGQLVVVPSPLLRHQLVAGEIFALLSDYRRLQGGLAVNAPFDIVFDEHDVVQPDIVFFRAERLHLLDPNAVTRAVPDIVIEVLSPSTAAADRGRKMRMFARYGVPECWIADPLGRQIEVYALESDGYRLTQTAVPGDVVRSARLPDLAFAAERVFRSP